MNLEREVLSRVLYAPGSLNTAKITAGDFDDPMCSMAFAAAVSLSSRGVVPDPITVGNEVPDFAKDIAMISPPPDVNFGYWEGELIKNVERRRLQTVLYRFDAMVNEGLPAGEIRERVEDELSRSVVAHSHSSIITIGDAAMRYGPRFEERCRAGGVLPGVPTGFEKLDSLTGGYQNATYFIGARPSQGKTALMLTMMRAAVKAGFGVGVISVESSDQELIGRLIAAEAPASASGLKHGVATPSEIVKVGNTVAAMQSWNGHIYFDTKADVGTVEGVARRMVRDMGVRIIYVDYLQRIHAPGAAKWEQVGAASRAMTDIAKGLGVPVVCLVQTGRVADNEAPSIGHFQHSSSIEQDADVAMVIQNQTDEEGQEESMLHVLKNRDGDVGIIPLYFDRQHVRFIEKGLHYG